MRKSGYDGNSSHCGTRFFVTGDQHVYLPRAGRIWRVGLLLLFTSAIVIGWPATDYRLWLHSGETPSCETFVLAASGSIGIVSGVWIIAGGLLGFPRLQTSSTGISLRTAVKTQWVEWSSLGEFELHITHIGFHNRQLASASASIVGPAACRSLLRRKRFEIADIFDTPISTIATELNARNPQAGGTLSANEQRFGLVGFRLPWMALSICGVLAVIFVCALIFTVLRRSRLRSSRGSSLERVIQISGDYASAHHALTLRRADEAHDADLLGPAGDRAPGWIVAAIEDQVVGNLPPLAVDQRLVVLAVEPRIHRPAVGLRTAQRIGPWLAQAVEPLRERGISVGRRRGAHRQRQAGQHDDGDAHVRLSRMRRPSGMRGFVAVSGPRRGAAPVGRIVCRAIALVARLLRPGT